MELFKAHFIHPYTQMPLIIYYNKSDGHVTFEKDVEVLNVLLHLEKKLAQDRQFLLNVEETTNLDNTQYPVRTFKDVYDLLEGFGVNKTNLTFKRFYVH